MKKILVLRFSAMGDVALLVPVITSLTKTYRDLEVTVATRPAFAPLFESLPCVRVFRADVDTKYRGFFGLRQLFRDLVASGNYSAIIDTHDHLRTTLLRTFFMMFGYRVFVFDKGRREKRAFVRRKNKITHPLPHTVERYAEVFRKAGFTFPIARAPYVSSTEKEREAVAGWLSTLGLPGSPNQHEYWIGVAPFAAHRTKLWPLENYKPLLKSVAKKVNARFFLFGGGDHELKFFDELCSLLPDRCHRAAGNLALGEELVLMSFLNLMVTVDSANMHMATLYDTPVLSIWGGTHPDVGFGPYGLGPESVIQVSREELECRPCSVYGKATCFRGDFACLNRITTAQVADRIIQKLNA